MTRWPTCHLRRTRRPRAPQAPCDPCRLFPASTGQGCSHVTPAIKCTSASNIGTELGSRRRHLGVHVSLLVKLRRTTGAREQLVRLYRWRLAVKFRSLRPGPRPRLPLISPAPPSELAVPCCGDDGPRATELRVACRGDSGSRTQISRSPPYSPIRWTAAPSPPFPGRAISSWAGRRPRPGGCHRQCPATAGSYMADSGPGLW